MKVGKIIQQLREEAHMLQSELAGQLGLGRTTISNYENNYSYPDLETLIAISQFFGVTTDYLLGLSNVRTKNLKTNEEEGKVLRYYNRLDSENKDYVSGEMIKLYREQEAAKNTSKSNIKNLG